MNKYIWSECPIDYWPSIKTIMANSYNNAVEKVISKYNEQFDDDEILNFDNWKHFREYLNDTYSIALSDLEDYEEL